MSKINIAIDGFSSCGKSTLAKQLAQKIGYVYVDSGAMYRAVTLFAMRNNCFTGMDVDKAQLKNALEKVNVRLLYDSNTQSQVTLLNNENVEEEIRKMRVSDSFFT